jgi:DNA-binding NarL/FixJ family response regulator
MLLPQYEILVADTLSKGKFLLKTKFRIDLVILDLLLPDAIHPLTTYLSVRQAVPKTPLLIVSGLEDETFRKLIDTDMHAIIINKKNLLQRQQIEDAIKELGYEVRDFYAWQEAVKQRIRKDG